MSATFPTFLKKVPLILLALAGLALWGCGDDKADANEPEGWNDPDGGGGYEPPPIPEGCVPESGATRDCRDGFCKVPGGCFLMGSPPTDPCRDPDEVAHWVILDRTIEVGQHEVTQAEFRNLMGYDPSTFGSCGASCPVERVSWHEACAYANQLSMSKGLAACYQCTGSGTTTSCRVAPQYEGQAILDCPGYRLPVEAEWEHAYRAGTTTSYYNGNARSCYENDATAVAIGWYRGNAGEGTHPGGQKLANGWGIYDMSGNVEEWVHDGYALVSEAPAVNPVLVLDNEDSHSARGGSWFVFAKDMRGPDRNKYPGNKRDSYTGFRVVRTVGP